MFNLSPSLSCSLSAGVILKVFGWSKDQSTSESPSIWQSPREHWRYWPERLAALQDSNVFAPVPVKALARMRHTSTVDLIWTVNTSWSFSINNQQQCQEILCTLEGFCAWSSSIGFLTLFAASQQLLLVVVLYVNCHFRSSLGVSHIPNCCCYVFKCSTAPGSSLLFSRRVTCGFTLPNIYQAYLPPDVALWLKGNRYTCQALWLKGRFCNNRK